jgi:hypothetical protein
MLTFLLVKVDLAMVQDFIESYAVRSFKSHHPHLFRDRTRIS